MSGNEDRKLQIELTRLQIRNERIISMYTVFLSVTFSLMLAFPSVYVPIYFLTNNYQYLFIPLLLEGIITVPFLWLFFKMTDFLKRSEREIQELKNEYVW